MFQTFNIPQGVYDVVIDVAELATNGNGRKKAGLFISKGGEEQLLIWIQVEIGQKIQTYLNRLIFICQEKLIAKITKTDVSLLKILL